MKWWICGLAAGVLTVIFGLPFREYETQKLLPVQTLQAHRKDGGVYLLTEVGEGFGSSWDEAVEDLRSNAAGEVFFDTAQQAIFSDALLAQQAAESGILRPSAQVYFSQRVQDVEGLSDYLSAHPSDTQISQLWEGP